jgi:hypothetical protein
MLLHERFHPMNHHTWEPCNLPLILSRNVVEDDMEFMVWIKVPDAPKKRLCIVHVFAACKRDKGNRFRDHRTFHARGLK